MKRKNITFGPFLLILGQIGTFSDNLLPSHFSFSRFVWQCRISEKTNDSKKSWLQITGDGHTNTRTSINS